MIVNLEQYLKDTVKNSGALSFTEIIDAYSSKYGLPQKGKAKSDKKNEILEILDELFDRKEMLFEEGKYIMNKEYAKEQVKALSKKYKIPIEKATKLNNVLNSEHLPTITNENLSLKGMSTLTGLALSTIKDYRGVLIAADLLEERGPPTNTSDLEVRELMEEYDLSHEYARKLKAALNPEYFPLLSDPGFSIQEIMVLTDLDLPSIKVYKNALRSAGII